jgi:hypothetical protein
VSFLVAVAVTKSSTGTFWEGAKPKEALPLRLVVTCICPRNVWPSPKLEESAEGLLKNWMIKVLFVYLVLGVLFSVPFMEVKFPNVWAEVIRG